MGFDSMFHYVNLTLQVFVLDLLLSGDNAVVIALACRSLPVAQMRQAMLIGTGAAVGLRILLTSVASLLLAIPMLKLIGGVALTVIAIKLLIEESDAVDVGADATEQPSDLWAAVGTIIVADVVMSVDNVVGLAAVTQGNVFFLTLGLLLSVPLLMYGSLFVSGLLQRYPLLIKAGGAMLGWVAGDIAMTDPMIADWINTQAPALTVVVPLLLAIFVVVESRIISEASARAAALRPAPRQKVAAVAVPPAPAVLAPVPTVAARIAPRPDTPELALPFAAPAPPPSASADDTPDTAEAVPAGARTAFSFPVPWIAVAAGLSLLAWIGFSLFGAHGMPKPADLDRYVCPLPNTALYYRSGSNIIRISSATATIGGVMHDGKVDWGDYPVANKRLGFPPPTSVKFGPDNTLQIDGGLFVGISCRLQPAN